MNPSAAHNHIHAAVPQSSCTYPANSNSVRAVANMANIATLLHTGSIHSFSVLSRPTSLGYAGLDWHDPCKSESASRVDSIGLRSYPSFASLIFAHYALDKLTRGAPASAAEPGTDPRSPMSMPACLIRQLRP